MEQIDRQARDAYLAEHPTTNRYLREIARWIAHEMLFDYSEPGDPTLRERMEDMNEGDGFTVELPGSMGHSLRTENLHLSTAELDLVFTLAAKIPASEVY